MDIYTSFIIHVITLTFITFSTSQYHQKVEYMVIYDKPEILNLIRGLATFL